MRRILHVEMDEVDDVRLKLIYKTGCCRIAPDCVT
jgi:hypothetical protein